jgi:hypothetical protein
VLYANAWVGCALVRVCRYCLPGGSWIRYRVLYTAPGGAEVASEWCAKASCAVARADLRVMALSSAEALTLDAVLDSHADVVSSLPCAGFEVQRAVSCTDLATAAPLRVESPPPGQATVVHRFVLGRGGGPSSVVSALVCSLLLVVFGYLSLGQWEWVGMRKRDIVHALP